MKNNKMGVSLILVTALALLVIATGSASAQLTATVSIDEATLNPLQTAKISINITDVPENNVSAALMNMTYDPSVVEIIAVDGSDFDIFDNNNSGSGELRMIGFQMYEENLQSPIKFADVTVKAVGNPGDYSLLHLEGEVAAEVHMGSGSLYHEVLGDDGLVSILGSVPAFNTFGLIALIGLLAIVLAVKVRKR